MNQLEAVNMLLRAIGASPVNSLTDPQPDKASALEALNRNSRKVQKRGWWYNIDYNVPYQPDELTGHVAIPEAVTTLVGDKHIVKRGNKLYDNCNQTYVFSETVTAWRVVTLLEWDDMPESVQDYAAYTACAELVRDELEDQIKEDAMKQEAGLAMIEIRKEDLEQGQYNVFQNHHVGVARFGVQPYRRNTIVNPTIPGGGR